MAIKMEESNSLFFRKRISKDLQAKDGESDFQSEREKLSDSFYSFWQDFELVKSLDIHDRLCVFLLKNDK